MASMVGSSWKAAESSGVAPIRSPAATVKLFAPRSAELARSRLRWVARYSTPPAGKSMLPLRTSPVDVRPGRVSGGTVSSWPWKSLIANRSTLTRFFFAFLALSALGAAAVVDVVSSAVAPDVNASGLATSASPAAAATSARPRFLGVAGKVSLRDS